MDGLKTLIWVGASKKELKSFPREVQRDMGQALFTAQAGGTDPAAKALKGFMGTTVMEIVESYQTDSYRTIYTVKYGEVVFVLLAFQKKSKTGIKTPKAIMDRLRGRLTEAKRIWQEMNK